MKCCICGHDLANHIKEENGWRCHAIGKDGYQCECWLRKNRYDNKEEYSIEKRIEYQRKELKEMDLI